jgi:hypothetical protein
MKMYFKDNFFSAGETEIWNEQQEPLGYLNLKSTFGSALEVYNAADILMYSGKFPFLSSKWQVFNSDHTIVGKLRSRFTFFAKNYTYDAYAGGEFSITSPAFSRNYEICDEYGALVASFQKVSGWFSSEAYCLDNTSEQLNNYELIAVVMGMNAIQKRRRSAASA